MSDEQDKIVQFLTSKVSYWDGLRSGRFWEEFKQSKQLISSIIYLLIALIGGVASIFIPESNRIARIALFLTSALMMPPIIFEFHYELRTFQLSR